jgi:uncharacterized protein
VARHQSKRKTQRMSISRRSFIRGLLGSMIVVALARKERPVAAEEVQSFPVSSLVILSRTGSHRFHVEVAETALQRMQGLQGRRTLDSRAGMLFIFDSQSVVRMWMKDTYIPLDMLFLDGAGGIVGIARDTRPLSLQPIQSPAPVKAVLELNAGTVDRLGLEVGHRVLHPLLAAAPPR